MKLVIPSVPTGLAPAMAQWCQGINTALQVLSGMLGPSEERAVRLSEAEAGRGRQGETLMGSVLVAGSSGEMTAARLQVQGQQVGVTETGDGASIVLGPLSGQLLAMGAAEERVAAADVTDGLYQVVVAAVSGASWSGVCHVAAGEGWVVQAWSASGVSLAWQDRDLIVGNLGAVATDMTWSLARMA